MALYDQLAEVARGCPTQIDCLSAVATAVHACGDVLSEAEGVIGLRGVLGMVVPLHQAITAGNA